ncbi:MAG: tRNA-specific adenosine deaminase [Flavisolibacter sp.]|jgi:tRNA(Arg) A34 adenosine deaminase TadA|nr:tRNA-specific adenosine deaminase [Flavisolibacter sp.]
MALLLVKDLNNNIIQFQHLNQLLNSQSLHMTREEKFMMEAIALSKNGSENGEGGPFGCVIVKDNSIIGRGNNKVTSTNDPTAHAEVVAIRDACKNLGTFQLDDCEIYTSCEPCPMCLGAIYWARPKVIYYANNREDAAAIGFDDSMIYEECSKPLSDRMIPMISVAHDEAFRVFEEWKENENKIGY